MKSIPVVILTKSGTQMRPIVNGKKAKVVTTDDSKILHLIIIDFNQDSKVWEIVSQHIL